MSERYGLIMPTVAAVTIVSLVIWAFAEHLSSPRWNSEYWARYTVAVERFPCGACSNDDWRTVWPVRQVGHWTVCDMSDRAEGWNEYRYKRW